MSGFDGIVPDPEVFKEVIMLCCAIKPLCAWNCQVCVCPPVQYCIQEVHVHMYMALIVHATVLPASSCCCCYPKFALQVVNRELHVEA